MPLVKLTVAATGVAAARAAGERLALLVPEPVAITEFEAPPTGGWRVEAYFETAPRLGDVAAATGLDVALLRLEDVPDENWVAISQAALPPVVAGRFVVHGSHDRARVGLRPGAIEIDAGEAFGTAHHATTLGCLEALDRLTRHRSGQRTIRRVLDLGCGSGVLAIAAARALPDARVIASDIDAKAVEVARGNLRRNRVARRVALATAAGFAHPVLRGPFELVLANILAGPLIVLAPALARVLAPAGMAVLSGILAEQSREVEAAYRAAGLSLDQKRILAGWATLVLRAPPP